MFRSMKILLLPPHILAFFAAGSNAQRKDLRPFHVNVFRIDAGMVAAKARGFFTGAGLDVTITQTPNSTAQMRGISQGKFDIAATAFDNVLAWSGKEGAEIVAIAQVSDRIVLPVFVRPEIHDWSELKGKKLAVDAVDTAFALVLRRVLLAHDLDLKRGDYELVAVGATGQRLESISRGDTFAGILNAPFDLKAVEAGLRRMGDSREVLPDYPSTVLAVNRAWGQGQRADLLAFLRAWMVGMRWAKDPANRSEAVKLVGAELTLSPKAAAGSVDELSAGGALNLAGLESVLKLRTDFGFTLLRGNSVASYYEQDYYRAATGN